MLLELRATGEEQISNGFPNIVRASHARSISIVNAVFGYPHPVLSFWDASQLTSYTRKDDGSS